MNYVIAEKQWSNDPNNYDYVGICFGHKETEPWQDDPPYWRQRVKIPETLYWYARRPYDFDSENGTFSLRRVVLSLWDLEDIGNLEDFRKMIPYEKFKLVYSPGDIDMFEDPSLEVHEIISLSKEELKLFQEYRNRGRK